MKKPYLKWHDSIILPTAFVIKGKLASIKVGHGQLSFIFVRILEAHFMNTEEFLDTRTKHFELTVCRKSQRRLTTVLFDLCVDP